MKRIEITITGRVQMVMFRDFAQRKARKLGVVGTVHNEADGSVRAVAEGDPLILERYLAYLHKGSLLSHVEDVHVVEADAKGNFSDFTIVY